jgi:hypothetical protein
VNFVLHELIASLNDMHHLNTKAHEKLCMRALTNFRLFHALPYGEINNAVLPG